MRNRSSVVKGLSVACGVAVMCGGLMVPATTKAADKVDFVKDVQPILEKSCVSCHGGKDKEGHTKLKGKLNLANKEGAMKGGENGAKDIVPGKSADSLVYKLLLGPVGKGDEEIKRMPAGKNAQPLPEVQIKIIEAWIDQGANWPDGVNLKVEK